MNHSNLPPRPVKEIMIDALEETLQAWRLMRLKELDLDRLMQLDQNIPKLEKLIADLKAQP